MQRSIRNREFWVTVGPNEGWEYVFGLVSVGLAITGPGVFSIDAALGIEDGLDGWVGAAMVAVGVAAAAAQMVVFFRPREVAEA